MLIINGKPCYGKRIPIARPPSKPRRVPIFDHLDYVSIDSQRLREAGIAMFKSWKIQPYYVPTYTAPLAVSGEIDWR